MVVIDVAHISGFIEFKIWLEVVLAPEVKQS